MNESDEYILGAIKTAVWSGFRTPDDVQQLIDDLVEDEGDADEASLRAAVPIEFANKARAEATWPEVTDCNRLDNVFSKASQRGFAAVQNAGYTMSDGLSDVSELAADMEPSPAFYCFYHGQDLERAVAGDGLTLAFGAFSEEPSLTAQAGALLSSMLVEAGFEVSWDGNPDHRLEVKIDWKRRGA